MNEMRLSRRGMLLGTGASLASLALERVACAAPRDGSESSGSPAIDSKETSGSMGWTVGNDRVQRRVCFDNSRGLFTEGFSDLNSSTELIRVDSGHDKPSPEFSFVCDGQHYRGSSSAFALISAEEEKLRNGKLLKVLLKNTKIPMEVTVSYAVYDGQPAIRKWISIKNVGSTLLHVSHLNIEAIAPSFGPSNEAFLNVQYGTIPKEVYYTGRSEDAGLLIGSARTGNGLAILSEVPGYMKRTEIGAFYDSEHIHIDVLYDTDLMPFSRTIAPAESFKTAAVSLVLFRNGDSFRDPRWVLPSYTSEILQRRNTAEGAPWIYNTWNPFKRDIDSATTHQLIGIAGRMGIDIFTIDDGWQRDYGENEVNLKSFPEGLDPIRKQVEAEGMRLGLWIPLAAIAARSAVGTQHPEWMSLDQSGEKKTTSTEGGEMIVMCLASAFSAAAAARVNDAIERFHLAYVKLDLTTIFNAYGEAPGCWAKGHDHGDWSESLGMIYEGISKVTSAVYRSHPDVLLDLTFELWGQKHVIDAGLLAAGDLDWISNVGDSDIDSAGPIQARTLLYQRAASMPVESMLIGNLQAGIPNPAEVFATALGAAPVMLGDLRKLSEADVEWYRSHISWFKKLRRRTRINESFFPLGSWRQPMSTEWDGFARLSRSGSGVIAAFRNKSAVSQVKIQLPLMPAGAFNVHSMISDKNLGDFTLDKWIEGIPVHFADGQTVEVLEVRSLQ
jgi:alpha-galactosidase